MSSASARRGGKRRRKFDDLFANELPRSASVICSNSMVNHLDDATQQLLRNYVSDRCPGSAEVVDALFWAAKTQPTQLRTKELCETLEAVTLIGASINALLAEDPARKESMTIYDLACGHGLGGVLLAYRFPGVRVVCMDNEERPCWTTYREAFERFGEKAKGNDTVMANLEFELSDVMNLTPKEGDYLVCIHGCNELSPFVLDAAKKHRTGYAVMPCCIRDGLVGITTNSANHNWGMGDATRYAVQVGYLAAKFDCTKAVAISHHITNRFLIIIGDWKAKSQIRPSGGQDSLVEQK